MREYGDLMLIELRKVIPEFLKRVDVDGSGRRVGARTGEDARADVEELAAKLAGDVEPEPRGRGQAG